MRSYYKKIIYFFFASMILASCSSNNDDTWDIIAAGLPKEISPKQASINMGLYVLKQTHEPLFRYKKRTEIYSNLLTKWHRDLENKSFNLCLKEGLNFNEEQDFKAIDFKNYLKDLLDKYRVKHSLVLRNNCVVVNFSTPKKEFLNLLTKYENAPSSGNELKSWEDGLGPFRVKSLTDKKITLTRKIKVKNGYNQINFWSYSGKSDPVLILDGIEDYNRVLISDFPFEKVKSYQKYNVALLQTVNLVLNVIDPSLRKNIFNCFVISEFRQAFMSNQSNFLDVGSILPIGVPKAAKERVSQKCDSQSLKGKKVTFHNWNKTNTEALRSYFKKLKNTLGLEVEIIDISMSQLVEMVFMNPHPYELTVVALDAVDIDYDAYFGPIINDKSILDIRNQKLKRLYKEFKNSSNKEIVTQIINEISNSHLILPLYQEVRDFYFPKNIKSLTLGRNDLEYLEISELEL